MAFCKNEQVVLTIDEINDTGDGIGRVDGFVVFVKGMLPGETGLVQIIKVKSSYAIGRLISLEVSSPSRVEPECEAFRKGCGGCAFCHMDYDQQLIMKRNRVVDCLTRIGGFDLSSVTVEETLGEERPFAGRNKSAYPFTLEGKTVRAGFYARNSHRVVPLPDAACCLTEKPEMLLVRKNACRLATDLGYSVYDETSGRGLLRHLVVRFSEYSGKAMVILVLTQKTLPREADFVAALKEACPFVSSIYVNVNTLASNVIFGRVFRLVDGEEYLLNKIGESVFRISPASFYQVNSRQTEKLYRTVYEYAGLNGSEKILDLYCGIGTIGISLLKAYETEHDSCQGITLAGVEIVEDAVIDAKENARMNKLDQAVFLAGDAPEGADYLLSRGYRPDLVILDPPRKGCDGTLLDTICSLMPPRIVYVSCDPATLARDLKFLCEKGYTFSKVQPVDMFPMSGHCECVVCLSRKTTHEMKLHASPFEMIKSGKKTIELRLYDEKRQRIKEGDVIAFTNTSNGEKMRATVKALHRFDSFEELYKTLPLLQCGYTAEDIYTAQPSDMEQYYSVEEQKKYGVVGIELFPPKRITDESVV
ncbi:MAG: 23S rRNA (uracil(1939)-C(5))-methyltransferase RlmD [Clostridia bacterium]|nr:23S rRNA (uracil(1939)-C(5))-methyltransferase RlmD [Clostridia bacterium]